MIYMVRFFLIKLSLKVIADDNNCNYREAFIPMLEELE